MIQTLPRAYPAHLAIRIFGHYSIVVFTTIFKDFVRCILIGIDLMLVIGYVVYPKLRVRILKPLAQTWLYMFFADATFFSPDWVNRIKDEPSRQGGLKPET